MAERLNAPDLETKLRVILKNVFEGETQKVQLRHLAHRKHRRFESCYAHMNCPNCKQRKAMYADFCSLKCQEEYKVKLSN